MAFSRFNTTAAVARLVREIFFYPLSPCFGSFIFFLFIFPEVNGKMRHYEIFHKWRGEKENRKSDNSISRCKCFVTQVDSFVLDGRKRARNFVKKLESGKKRSKKVNMDRFLKAIGSNFVYSTIFRAILFSFVDFLTI